MKDIRAYLDENHPEVYEYLPEPSLELPKTPKAWVANVCATVLGEEFSQWVRRQVEVRHGKVSVQKNLLIQMDPEMAEIFRNSTAVSSKCINIRLFFMLFFKFSKQGRVSIIALN